MGTSSKTQLLMITGVSGAGLTTAMAALQDAGFECFENTPVFLVEDLIEKAKDADSIAIALDSRTRGMDVSTLSVTLARLRANQDYDVKTLFFDCKDEILIRRYSETRRMHPMANGREPKAGIEKERQIFEAILSQEYLIERVIDTTSMTPHDLRSLLKTDYAIGGKDSFSVTVTSFSYKKGIPSYADIVEDVRFLSNPHWNDDLRPLTGQNKHVQSFIEADQNFSTYRDETRNRFERLLPLYKKEGKSYLHICFGCTGGKHRSVFLAEEIASVLKNLGYSVTINHRDMPTDDIK